MITFQSQPQLRWISVGLQVLAACAGRSTRRKGFQQTLRPSHPVRAARKNLEGGEAGFGNGKPSLARLASTPTKNAFFTKRICHHKYSFIGRRQQREQGRAGQGVRGQKLRRSRASGRSGLQVGHQRPGNPPDPLGSILTANGREVIRGAASLQPSSTRKALPSLTVLTGRSAGGLGRSLERPCKWSAALSAV